MSDLKWFERYSVSRASVGRLGNLVVAWSDDRAKPGFIVSAFGVTLESRSEDIEDGKRRAIALGVKLLAQAHEQLKTAHHAKHGERGI